MRSTRGLFLLLALTGACKVSSTPPPRPLTVPAAAVWAWGEDGSKNGGVWILCEPRQDSRDFACGVYNPFGDLVVQGRYRASPEDAVSKGLDFSYFDGQALRLRNGGQLVPSAGR